MRCQTYAVLSLLFFSVALTAGLDVKLTTLSTVYLPKYENNGESFKLLSYTLEQIAYDPEGKLIYAAGTEVLHVIDASDFSKLTALDHLTLPDRDLVDVEVCGEGVFASYVTVNDARDGGVLVYRKYQASSGFSLVRDIPMNGQPDMIQTTADCTLVLALQNEGVVVGGQFYDPPGGVGIVRFPSGITGEPEVKVLDFTKFDNQYSELSKSGVRWVYRTSSNKFSDTVEPESVAFNADFSKAYLSLQDNNAVAVVDMATDSITAIHGLGFKQWGELDPSDKDGGINIKEWPVYGMYQPDSLLWFRWNNQDYVITANEGASVYYDAPNGFSEETRGAEFADADIAASVTEDVKQALKDDSKLGRLKFSNVEGKNAEGKYEQFYTFGARGFSIWRASDMERVFDSGSDMEKKSAQLRPDIFNTNVEVFDSTATLLSTVDTRSDDKGPETQTVLAAELADHALLFVTNERSSTIAVYSMAKGGLQPVFEALYTDTIPKSGKTWFQLYDDRQLFGIDPESIVFVPSRDGNSSQGVLLVGGTVTGTVTAIQVEATKPATTTTKPKGSATNLSASNVLLAVVCSCVFYLLNAYYQ